MAGPIAPSSDMLMEALTRETKRRVAVVLEEEIAATVERVRKRLAEEADKLALGVLGYYEVGQDAHRLFITVKKDRAP